MGGSVKNVAFFRTTDAPVLPAPASTVGARGWLTAHLFSSPLNTVVTVLLGGTMAWIAWSISDWALVTAVWRGESGKDCAGEGLGACGPLVFDKTLQWIYGFYPISERWRPNLVFLLGAAGLVPMLIPAVPFKALNALYLLLVFPLVTLVLLTGGHFGIGMSSFLWVAGLMLAATAALPAVFGGLEVMAARNRWGTLAILFGGLPYLAIEFFFGNPLEVLPGVAKGLLTLILLGAALSLQSTWVEGRASGIRVILGWLGVTLAILAAMAFLNIDFGLVPVETSQWGGLLVTLVVSVTGIVASLPIGIVLALARRSNMPVVRLFAVLFIELWRGVPLITVLFFSSVMLPLFLPEGTVFDKLLRALIGVALFSAAYMAEVVRSGLQAIPRGQYEGAMALGLSFWQSMRMIILPQALKISIPNIVGNFISLFKDTTLVAIIGLFDLFGMVRASVKDANWVSPTSVATGYLTLAAIYWVFCFSMSRYSMYTERRLGAGQKR